MGEPLNTTQQRQAAPVPKGWHRMTESAPTPNASIEQMPQPHNAAIEAILLERFPTTAFLNLVGNALSHFNPAIDKTPELVERRRAYEEARASLEALPPEELQRLYAATIARKAAAETAIANKKNAEQAAKNDAKEAARFYNQPSALADFAYWRKVDFWTIEESVALLLGKDPSVVNSVSLRGDLAPDSSLFSKKERPQVLPEFFRTYERLHIMLSRAEALQGPALRPCDVVSWAYTLKAVSVPPELMDLISAKTSANSDHDFCKPEAGALPNQPRTELTPPVKWTAELLASLEAYRKAHGTKAAAKHFGISDARVRQLLPKAVQKPIGYSAFSHRGK